MNTVQMTVLGRILESLDDLNSSYNAQFSGYVSVDGGRAEMIRYSEGSAEHEIAF